MAQMMAIPIPLNDRSSKLNVRNCHGLTTASDAQAHRRGGLRRIWYTLLCNFIRENVPRNPGKQRHTGRSGIDAAGHEDLSGRDFCGENHRERDIGE